MSCCVYELRATREPLQICNDRDLIYLVPTHLPKLISENQYKYILYMAMLVSH